ncbi:MAG: hypothetical protein IPN85_09815 [Flavobacteriales bacterium]|nr:hypothetical protein [Flavobacteriales bacterium]
MVHDRYLLALLHHKQDVPGIYLLLKASDAQEDAKHATLPYYPYMKLAIVALR